MALFYLFFGFCWLGQYPVNPICACQVRLLDPSTTSKTPSRQESHSSSSSSSSSCSPTVSEIQTREREDRTESDISPVTVSTAVDDRPAKNEVLRVAWNPNPVFDEMWFLTIDPFIRISVFIAKLSERQYCWRVFEDFQSIISNYLTHTVASSCVCTSPLAVMTIVGLDDFVKVSISASLKSFVLIICIDAPESTTNSLSSGLRFNANKHQFSEGEKNVALSCSFNFNTLLASFHAASRAPRL